MMNKETLISEVATKLGTTKKDTRIYLEAIEQTIVETLEKGESVNLHGFLSLNVSTVEESVKADPRSRGEGKETRYVTVPRHNKVTAKVSSTLKKIVK